MELSKRLKTIVSCIYRSVIADIGCDHALVCIEALQKGLADKAYACDLRVGPLAQAAHNIEEAGLSQAITTRLQSGIHALPDDTEQVIVCGMGGRLIEEILEADPLPASVESLILCPHKDAAHLRRWLLENGFVIEREKMVWDEHFYPVLMVRLSGAVRVFEQKMPVSMDMEGQNGLDGKGQGEKAENMEKTRLEDEESLLFGFHMEPDADALAFLNWQKKQWEKILVRLPQNRRAGLARQLALLENRKKKVEASLAS